MPTTNRSDRLSRKDLKSTTLTETKKTQGPSKSLNRLSMLMNSSRILKKEESMTRQEKTTFKDSSKMEVLDFQEEEALASLVEDLDSLEEVSDFPEGEALAASI